MSYEVHHDLRSKIHGCKLSSHENSGKKCSWCNSIDSRGNTPIYGVSPVNTLFLTTQAPKMPTMASIKASNQLA